MNTIFNATQVETDFDIAELIETDKQCALIVWNDEVNTFDNVIEALIAICGHDTTQAEQCALLIHTKGKYPVKKGNFETMKRQCDAITERNIGATVEELA